MRGATTSHALRLALCAALTALLLAPATATAATRVHSAWLPYWSFRSAYASVLGNADLIRTASPFWYEARTCRTIISHAGAGGRDVIDGLHARGIRVVPTVASPLRPRAAIACLGNAGSRHRHVAALLRLVRAHGYDGLDLDYEHLALTTRPALAARVRAAFTAFAQELCDALQAARRECSVTVMPRTSDDDVVWRSKLLPSVYDYAVLGAAATRLRVMAYDEHAPNTTPGPIAGLPWVRAVAAYTRSRVPAAQRVELGVPLYGRDWSRLGVATLTAAEARALAARHGARIVYDRVQRAPWFRYIEGRVSHTVWFSDARSVGERSALAESLGFAGMALWAAGQEDAATWPALRRMAR